MAFSIMRINSTYHLRYLEYISRTKSKIINKLNNEYIKWEDFMNGMLTIRDKTKTGKMDLFFKVIFFIQFIYSSIY